MEIAVEVFVIIKFFCVEKMLLTNEKCFKFIQQIDERNKIFVNVDRQYFYHSATLDTQWSFCHKKLKLHVGQCPRNKNVKLHRWTGQSNADEALHVNWGKKYFLSKIKADHLQPGKSFLLLLLT